jgi:hypothetical protein
MIEIKQQPDRLPGRLIAGLAGTLFGSVVAGAIAAILIARCGAPPGTGDPLGGGEKPAPVHDVHGVEVGPFELPTQGEEQRAKERRRLDSYGWVDRDAGIAHIPIDRAIDQIAAGAGQPSEESP